MKMFKPCRVALLAASIGLLALNVGLAKAGELKKGGWKMTFPNAIALVGEKVDTTLTEPNINC